MKLGGGKSRRKKEKFWDRLSSTMKWIFILLLLMLIIAILKEMINLMEWNDILIRRVQTTESQLTDLRVTMEALELENQSLQIENAKLTLQNVQVYNPQVSTNPPIVWGPFPEPITKPEVVEPTLNPLEVPDSLILVPIAVAGWQIIKLIVFRGVPLPI